MYGNINPSLFDSTSTIIVNSTANFTYTFLTNGADLAMDNINITAINANEKDDPIIISAVNSNIFMVDSYISEGYDISYYSRACNILQNDRYQLQ